MKPVSNGPGLTPTPESATDEKAQDSANVDPSKTIGLGLSLAVTSVTSTDVLPVFVSDCRAAAPPPLPLD